MQAKSLYRNEDGCSSLQINTFSDTPPSRMLPHMEGVCLLGSIGEAEDLPLEAHQALVIEISGGEMDALLEKDYVGPHLQSSKCQLDDSLEVGSSRQLSHEQVIVRVGVFHDLYDLVAKYMQGLGEGNDWSHLCLKD